MKKIFNKKVRAVIKLSLFVILVLSCVFFGTYPTSAKEDSYDVKYGIPASNGARKKLYAGGLIDCVADMKTDKISGGSGTSEKIFKSSTYMKGIILEDEINGVGNSAARKDGLISCQSLEDSDGNNLWTKLKINRAELFCASGTDPGLFRVVDGTGSCQDVYSGNAAGKLEPVAKSNRDFFTRELIRRKAFNNNIPGDNVETFLPIEQYYVYRDSFFAICANYDTRREDDSVHYRIYDYVGGDEFKKYGYGDKGIVDPASDKFWVSKWDGQMSCDQLMQKLNTGDAFTAWVEDTRGSTEGPIRYGENLPGSDDTDGTSGDGTSTSQKTCLTEADSLGWLGCETAESMGSFGSSAYKNLVTPYLEVSPQLFSGDDGARKAWGIFMSIANGGFVILLIVIIFSQLTGIGIDNYGIKKILPKIIVTVILVNASYIICQAAVDVSNIIGGSLLGMLEQIAGQINGQFDLGVMVDALVKALGISGAGVGITIVSGGFWAFLLPLLLGLLGVIIAILFVFFLLGARKALVVVLVVVSPIAMLLYALPNTKKIFDKWFKIFKGMLILYPVCGLLMGGGALASSIILKSTEISNEEDYWTVLSGMVVRIIPIFFIPSLVKGAFAALGGVGAKLSGLGKNLSNKATGGINKGVRNSDMWKDYQRRHGVNVARTKGKIAGKKLNWYNNHLGEGEGQISRDGNLGKLMQKRADALNYQQTRNEAKVAAYDNEHSAANLQRIKDEAYSKEVDNALSMMKTNGIDGQGEFTTENMEKALSDLATNGPAGQDSKSIADYNLKVSALARGLAAEKGGASKLAKIIRGKPNGSGNPTITPTSAFLNTMGGIYTNDSAVRTKLQTKDTGASYYIEKFSRGGQYSGKTNVPSFTQFKASEGNSYANVVGTQGRIRSAVAGVDQGGPARQEYLESMSIDEFSNLANSEAFKNLDDDVQAEVKNYFNGHSEDKFGGATFDSLRIGSAPTTPNDGMTGELDLRSGNDNSGGDNNNNNGDTYTAGYGDDTTYST